MGRLVKQDRQVGETGRTGQSAWGDRRTEQTDWGDRLNRTGRLGRLVEQDRQVGKTG